MSGHGGGSSGAAAPAAARAMFVVVVAASAACAGRATVTPSAPTTVSAPAVQETPGVALRADTLAPGLYRVSGGAGGSVIVFTGEEGTMLVDSRERDEAGPLREIVGRLSDTPVRFVVNTHYHYDHVGGNAIWRGQGATLVGHERLPAEARKDTVIPEMDDWHREPAPPEAIPSLTFADSMMLHLNGEAVRVLHAPAAHTGGDAMVVFPRENVIHMGDILELGAYPFLDWWSGGSLDGILAAVDRVLAMADAGTRIVPGHGRVVDRQGLADYRAMLVTVRERVRGAVAAGKSIDEMSATLPTKEFDASYGGERQGRRFARLIYYGLTRPGA